MVGLNNFSESLRNIAHRMIKGKTDFFLLTLISVIFFIANFFLLLNTSIFWDDYVWTGQKLVDYLRFSEMLYGISYPGIIAYLTFTLPISLVRVGVFLALLLPGFVVFNLMRRFAFDRGSSFLVSLTFLLSPMNWSFYTLSCSPYVFYQCMFYCAVKMLFDIHGEHSWAKRFVALCLFYLSFTLNSLLVFYFIPIFCMVLFELNYSSHRVALSFGFLLSFIKRRIDFVLLPFLFFAIKMFAMRFNTTYLEGVYASSNYNKITLSGVLAAPREMYRWYNLSFEALFSIISETFNMIFGQPLITLSFLILCLVGFSRVRVGMPSSRHLCGLFGFGILSFGLAIFPYTVVGHFFYTDSLNSRHTILSHFGIAILLFTTIGFLSRLFNFRAPVYFGSFSILLFSFCLTQLRHGKAFFIDSLKQESLIQYFKRFDEIKANNAFVFEDHTIHLNARRTYNHYDFSGLFYKAFDGEETRLGAYNGPNSLSELRGAFEVRENLPYKAGSAKTFTPTHKIIIKAGKSNPSFRAALWLAYLRIFDPSQYRIELFRILSVSVVSVDDSVN